MDNLTRIFAAYRDYTNRSARTRPSRQGQKLWRNSPIHDVKDFSAYNGRFMAEIPFKDRLADVNPHLIDQLQEIWDKPHTSIQRRLLLLDTLEENIHSARSKHLGNMVEVRLTTFKDDPYDGTPKKAAP